MKIICISDSHCALEKIKIPHGDILLHTGDLTFDGSIQQMIKQLKVLGNLSHKYKIFTCGNHDWLGEKNPSLLRQLCKDNDIIYLENEFITIENLKIYGSPVTPEFHNWAFNKKRGEEIAKYWSNIPEDTDILMTHGPMYGVLDEVNGENVGCEELYKAIQRVQPKLHVCGHIHSARNHYNLMSTGTLCINASVMSDWYTPIYKPYIVNFENGKFEVELN